MQRRGLAVLGAGVLLLGGIAWATQAAHAAEEEDEAPPSPAPPPSDGEGPTPDAPRFSAGSSVWAITCTIGFPDGCQATGPWGTVLRADYGGGWRYDVRIEGALSSSCSVSELQGRHVAGVPEAVLLGR